MSIMPMEGSISRPSPSQKIATAIVVLLPFLAFLVVIHEWSTFALLPALLQLGMWYLLTVLGITISFHRELTHRALLLVPLARYSFAVLGSLSVEGSVFSWCAKHRKHHQFTDRTGDPHSPHGFGDGIKGVLKGFLHAHIGWFFTDEAVSYGKYIPDLLRDKGLVRIDRLFPLWVTLSFILPGFISLFFLFSLKSFVAGVLWAGAVRIFLVHHVTWSINSVCHLWGTRPFENDDLSTNNFVFGYAGGGEGWHHNHHVFPWSARMGLRWWEFDLGWGVIRIMNFFGLVKRLRVPTSEEIEKMRKHAA